MQRSLIRGEIQVVDGVACLYVRAMCKRCSQWKFHRACSIVSTCNQTLVAGRSVQHEFGHSCCTLSIAS